MQFSPVPDNLQAHHANGYRSHNRHRLGGGVAVLTKHPLTRIATISTRDCQASITRTTDGITLIGCYVSPQQPKANIDSTLSQLSAYMRGKCILFGDFNARARLWDTTQNVHGSALQRLISRHHMDLSHPDQPTSSNAKIDLFLSKGLYPGICTTESGSWNTDHRLVMCKFNGKPPWKPPRIPRKILRDPVCMDRASQTYKEKIPPLVTKLEACNSAESLESICKTFCKRMMEPFPGLHAPRSKRFRKGWTAHLDKLAAKRKKLIIQQARNPSESTAEAIKSADKEIKRKRRANIRACDSREAKELSNLGPLESASRFSKNCVLSDCKPPPTLDGDSMTAHLQSQQTHSARIQPTKFSVAPSFAGQVRKALARSPRNRAPGPDGIVVELLLLNSELSAKFITELWTAVGRIGYMPRFLLRGVISPIFKKGDTALPANYRPICLISHVRKIISSAVNSLVQAAYKFHPQQFGFTPGLGTENASISAAAIVRNGHQHIGILDLKGAYDRVRRDRLLEICKSRLPTDIAGMIQSILVQTAVSTVNQHSTELASITVGVPQGDPISPTLYNMFMDTFLESFDQLPDSVSALPAQCYADDVMLSSRSASGLQRLLDISQQWASLTHMTWSVSKCSVISSSEEPLSLLGEPLTRESATTYLGTTITLNGLTDSKCIERAKSATNQLQQWKRINRARSLGLHRHTREVLVKQFLLPVIDFGIHLATISPQLQAVSDKFESNAITWIFQGRNGSNTARARSLVRLPTLTTRRNIQLTTRCLRTWDMAVQLYWKPTTCPYTRDLSIRSYEQLSIHPTCYDFFSNAKLQAPAFSHMPTLAQPQINSMKLSALSADFAIGNIGNIRLIPTSVQRPPAYTCRSSTQITFADKWYLNRLPRLTEPQHALLIQLMSSNQWNSTQLQQFKQVSAAIMRHINEQRTEDFGNP